MKLVVFGAGKIGRSFIGQLFSRSGYEVVFIDKDRRLINAINEKRTYKVIVCDDNPEMIMVENVRGVDVDDTVQVIDEIASADLMAISIGKNGLSEIIPLVAKGFLKREKDHPGKALDLILAENLRNANAFFYNALSKVLPLDYPLKERIGLVETSIGKMVPLVDHQGEDDLLSVSAESYNTLIVDKNGFKNPVPEITGLEAKENMKAWVDRKLFIHNFGHAAVAYYGYLLHPECVFIWEVLEDTAVKQFAKEAMSQSAVVLQHLYPGIFTDAHIEDHINDLLRRFANRRLGDTVFRVGCDLYRKLSPDDRIVVPLLSAFHLGLPYDKMIQVLSAALCFKATGPDNKMLLSDIDFHHVLAEKGKKAVIEDVCGFTNIESLRDCGFYQAKISTGLWNFS